MRASTIIAAASAFLASTTVAAPAGPCRAGPPTFRPRPKCMSEEDALIIAGNFQQLIQGYTKEMALNALTEDFVDYSSAVSIVINKGAAVPKDVTAPIFTSRAQFMEGHGKQQPIPFETLDVWHNCNGTVTMKWRTDRSAQGQATEAAAIPVIGMVVLETIEAEEGNPFNYRIHTIHSEFNTAAWLVNLGVFDPAGETTPVPAGKRSVMEWYEVSMI